MRLLLASTLGLIAAAALGGEPAPKETSHKGEVIDMVCYLSKGAHGAAHKDCAQTCLKQGLPAALLSDGKLYALLAAHGGEAAMDQVKAHAGDEVTVVGQEVDKDGLRAIFVSTVK